MLKKEISHKENCCWVMIFFTIFSIIYCVHSTPLNVNRTLHAIIGEASGEGFVGMLAVSGAIRNRGTLDGVYGSNHKRKESSLVFVKAVLGWSLSKLIDITNGATHWESIKFKTPYWSKSMTLTKQIGNHKFWR